MIAPSNPARRRRSAASLRAMVLSTVGSTRYDGMTLVNCAASLSSTVRRSASSRATKTATPRRKRSGVRLGAPRVRRPAAVMRVGKLAYSHDHRLPRLRALGAVHDHFDVGVPVHRPARTRVVRRDGSLLTKPRWIQHAPDGNPLVTD